MLRKIVLFVSASALMFSCTPDIDELILDNGNNENVDPIIEDIENIEDIEDIENIDELILDNDEISNPVITDAGGIEINMAWETDEDYFMLLLDLVVEDDFNEEISISENVSPLETVEIRSSFDDGTYNVIIQGADFSRLGGESEEVTFIIRGFNGAEAFMFTVDVNELEEFDTVTVIQIDVAGDSYTIRQIVDTI